MDINIIFDFPQDYSDIEVLVNETPSIELEVLTQGLEGAKGLKGDKGDALVYNLLTPEEKSEVIAQFDSAVGNTSYANIFLNAYLS